MSRENTGWFPASGYLNKWRVVRYLDGRLIEHETPSGKRWLCKNISTAWEKSIKLNSYVYFVS